MNEDLRNDELLRSYLLDKLPEEEAERLEERLIEEDELFELCKAVEAELLAAYDRGELTGLEKEQVHRLAFSPGGRERLAFMRALNSAAQESERTGGSVVLFRRRLFPIPRLGSHRAALAAGILLAAIGAYWAATRIDPYQARTQMPTPPRQAGTSQPEPPVAPVPPPPPIERKLPPQQDELAVKQPERPEPYVIALSLAVLRGAENVEEFHIPPRAELVEIQIDLIELGLEKVKSFQAAVRNQEGGTIWDREDLKPRQVDGSPVLVLKIPAEHLTDGRYEVAVTAGTEVLTPKEFGVVREHG